MLQKFIGFTVLSFISCWHTSAQESVFVPYSVKEGLAQSQVRDILQTADGHLWIATVGGISRFDGQEFSTYNKSKGLRDNLVTSMYESPDGKLFLSTKGAISILADDSIEHLTFPSPFADVYVFDMVEFEGAIALATNGSGLLLLRNGEFEQVLGANEDQNFIRSLALHDQRLWAGSKGGVLRLNEGRLESITDTVSVWKIISHEEKVWAATDNDGVFAYSDGEVKNYTVNDGLNSDHQRDVCADSRGHLWFVSKNSVSKFHLESEQFQSIIPVEAEQAANLKVIFSDRENNIWIGTDGHGMLKYTGDRFKIHRQIGNTRTDAVMGITQDANGCLWIATYGNGLIKKCYSEIQSFGYADGLLNATIWSLLAMPDGDVWIGSSGGINIAHETSSGLKIRDFEGNKWLPFPRVSVMYRNADGTVWIGTRDGLLIWKNDAPIQLPALNGVSVREVKSILSMGSEVFVGAGDGLYQISANGQAIKKYDINAGLSLSHINCLAAGTDGMLYIGLDDGIDQLNTATGQVEHIALADQFSSNIVNFLWAEPQGEVWAGTDNGLFSIRREGNLNIVTSYNEHDGVVGQECNQNAAFGDLQGMGWFGTNGALIQCDLSASKWRDDDPLKVNISEWLVHYEPQRLGKNPPATELKAEANRITYRYSALHFSNPTKIRYSYRLAGGDEPWSPETPQREVTFANLPPGAYAFEVRARLENEPWSLDIASHQFIIKPPFYGTWWFRLLALSALLVVTAVVYRFRLRQRKRRQQLTEMQNRAKIIGLEQQTLNAHMNRHFIFNALNSIQYFINTSDKKQANQYLINFASLVRKNLDSAQVESISLRDELDRLLLYLELEQMRFPRRFQFELKVSADIDAEQAQVPSMLLQPFVENSIMHGILPAEHEGRILIDVAPDGEAIRINISDNGIGINHSLNQKKSSSSHVSNGMKITRQRMELMRNTTQKPYAIHGPYEVLNNGVCVGTEVRLTIPLNYRT